MSIEKILIDAGLRVTPQRLIVLEAVCREDSHLAMDEIIQQVQSIQPHIATGTIYNTIDLFIEKNIIKRMKTESGNMRFDSETKHHHHLVQVEPNQIKDYFDDELDELLREYFTQKQLDDFEIESIKVEIQGKFK